MGFVKIEFLDKNLTFRIVCELRSRPSTVNLTHDRFCLDPLALALPRDDVDVVPETDLIGFFFI